MNQINFYPLIFPLHCHMALMKKGGRGESWLVLRPGNNTDPFIDGPVRMNDHDITV
jgi:hypothetical protein